MMRWLGYLLISDSEWNSLPSGTRRNTFPSLVNVALPVGFHWGIACSNSQAFLMGKSGLMGIYNRLPFHSHSGSWVKIMIDLRMKVGLMVVVAVVVMVCSIMVWLDKSGVVVVEWFVTLLTWNTPISLIVSSQSLSPSPSTITFILINVQPLIMMITLMNNGFILVASHSKFVASLIIISLVQHSKRLISLVERS